VTPVTAAGQPVIDHWPALSIIRGPAFTDPTPRVRHHRLEH